MGNYTKDELYNLIKKSPKEFNEWKATQEDEIDLSESDFYSGSFGKSLWEYENPDFFRGAGTAKQRKQRDCPGRYKSRCQLRGDQDHLRQGRAPKGQRLADYG